MGDLFKVFFYTMLCICCMGVNTRASIVAVHDPSIIIVYKDAGGDSYPENDAAGTRTKYYYIFGTQLGAAYSRDMINWTSFTPAFSVNGVVTTNYLQVFKAAADWSRHTSSNDLRGNLWAPDIIYNKRMNKWCLYFSVNGDDWLSSVVMHTASRIEGPYEYAGTVVYSGMDNASNGAGNADFQRVTGLNSVSTRYLRDGGWHGDYGSSCIDPSVLYDENNRLWMVYGSWSGGVFLLKLDENTGLRDYNYNYGFTNTSADGTVWNGSRLRYDPYMGVHLSGGYYVSGEGPYIQYLTDTNGEGYYYLFVTHGFYSPEGGYTMRVFRSKTIDGVYTDVTGDNAVFDRYIFNYGNNVQYGFPIMQNFRYNWWSVGQVAQGHNSVLRDEDGSAYLVYHTKYDNGTVHHNVEVHQLFFNERGWPLAAPFEYRTGFGLGKNAYTAEDIAGRYSVITHNAVDYVSLATNREQELYINADGTLSGTYTGTWSYDYAGGSQFLTLVTTAGTFYSVLCEQLMDGLSGYTLAFTGMNPASERALWGYKHTGTTIARTTYYDNGRLVIGTPDYGLAWDAYSDFHRTEISGDFEIEYIFDNYTRAVENWHNWAIALTSGGQTWYTRADAWSNSTFTGSVVNYKYGWNWETEFKEVYKNKEVRVKISKTGTSANVFAFVGDQLVYTSTATNCPSGNYIVYLGGEACYLDVKKVSAGSIGERQRVGTVNDDGTYTVGFNVARSQTIGVSGDFELNYAFNNYRDPVSNDNWDNYIIRAISGGQTMLLRADAYAMDVAGSLNYSYDWSWNDFVSLMSGANVELTIKRKSDVVTYNAVITARNGQVYNYNVTNTGAPIYDMEFGFTCEESMVDLFKAEIVEYVKDDVVTGAIETESDRVERIKVYGGERLFHIEATLAGQASVYSVEGRLVATIAYQKGLNTYRGFDPGVYIVDKNKVMVY